MRILFVNNLYPPVVFGGYEILCRQVCHTLRARGHEVRILTSNFMADSTLSKPNVSRLLSLSTDFPLPNEKVGTVDFSLKTMNQVGKINYRHTLKILDTWPCDLVFFWCMNRLGAGPFVAAKKRGIPLCYSVNDEHPKQFSFSSKPISPKQIAKYLAERLIYPYATFAKLNDISTTVISAALKHNLTQQGFDMERAVIIHQGVPLENFPFEPKQREKKDDFRLLYAGQLSRVKGVHTILEALGRMKKQGQVDFHLDLAGNGEAEYENYLRLMVKSENLENNVTFLGKLKHSKMSDFYRTGHALVFASEWEEPFGLSHLESMASGCSVISTTTGGSGELIQHLGNALAFEPGNADDLKYMIRLLMEDESLRISLIKNARTWVEKRHSFMHYVDKLEDFITQAVEVQSKEA